MLFSSVLYHNMASCLWASVNKYLALQLQCSFLCLASHPMKWPNDSLTCLRSVIWHTPYPVPPCRSQLHEKMALIIPSWNRSFLGSSSWHMKHLFVLEVFRSGSFLITQQDGVSPFGACPPSRQYLFCHCKAVGPLDPSHLKILLWLLEICPALLQANKPASLPSWLPVLVSKRAKMILTRLCQTDVT